MRRSLSEPFRDFAWTSGLAGYSFGLTAPTSTRASHRWIRRAIQKPTQPSSATRSAPRVHPERRSELQAAVVLEATVNAKQQRAPAKVASLCCCKFAAG
jgi:hypothetical protein